MPVRGLTTDFILDDLHRQTLGWLGEGVDWFDVHTHIGRNDPDGYTAEAGELLEALELAGQHGALVFAMHEPGGYRAANDAVLAAAEGSGGRLLALGRVDPNRSDALDEARRCLDRGARGIKLHPRSEGFEMSHPVVEQVVAEADERRAVVLFHAGRGIPALGATAVDLARRHPGARIVLAHAGISDLELLAGHARELPNLLFDTAWWHPTDVLALFAAIPPGQILYASDMPYGPPKFASAQLGRCARAVGLDPAVAREIAGAQGRRAASAEHLVDLGPARNLAYERVLSYLTSAVQMTFRGGDPEEALSLAQLACRADDPVLEFARRSIEQARAELALGDRFAIIEAALAAQLVVSTPSVEVPG